MRRINHSSRFIEMFGGNKYPNIRLGEFTDLTWGHKLAIAEIRQGEAVYKYGEVMGVASRDIHVGDWAHIHNIDSTRGRGDKAGKEREA